MKTRPAASGELTEVREVASLVLDGRDQTGIVAAVGSLLRDHGANIAHSTAELQRRGADVERAVLSRAVLWHAEDRIIRIGNHTVVFG
jgi:formyltetrahydrofolate hydrolase